jgi:hypothetical protein
MGRHDRKVHTLRTRFRSPRSTALLVRRPGRSSSGALHLDPLLRARCVIAVETNGCRERGRSDREQSSRFVLRRQIRVYKQRQVPAKTFNAVPIRGYQSGQPPCPLARAPRPPSFVRGPPLERGVDWPFHINDPGGEPPRSAAMNAHRRAERSGANRSAPPAELARANKLRPPRSQ